MNEQTSRKLDLWVGVPLCWLLTGWLRLTALFRSRKSHDAPPQKILFIKLSEMGAIVLTMPAFEAARRRVGAENLYCLMLAGNREVHDLLGVFRDEHLWSIRDRNLFAFAIDVWRFMRQAHREGIDCVIDLEGFSRISALLTALSGARLRVGLDRYTAEGLYRGQLFTRRVSYNYYNHASVQFLTMVEALDAPHDEVPALKRRVSLDDYRLPIFQPRDDEVAATRELLQSRCGFLPESPLVILNPNLIDLLPLRRWPRESFAALGQRILADHPQATIVLTGLPEQRELSQELAGEISHERALSLAGETADVRSLVVLFTLADLLITSDCGPAHMAALTEIPIVSIFGPETPRLYSPLSPHNHSLWAGLACSPCLHAFNHRKSACRDNVCMRAISVEDVYAAARAACPALESQPGQTPAAP